MPGAAETLEVTALGDSGRSYIRHLRSGACTVEGLYDNVNSTGVDVVANNLLAATTAITLRYAPGGTSSGATPLNRFWGASAWAERYELTGRVGDAIGFTMEFRLEDVPTLNTFT